MFRRIVLVAMLTPFIANCSGGSESEKTQKLEAVEAQKSALALCTGGAVPDGADSCLLDLGGGADSHWADTDGVAPGTAGCHIEYETGTCELERAGREFGEFCLDADRLVESNPGKNECHTHGNDRGKPDVVSCSEWCQRETGSTGRCEGEVMVRGDGHSCESAHCVCDAPT